jgi:hypothetical protein
MQILSDAGENPFVLGHIAETSDGKSVELT